MAKLQKPITRKFEKRKVYFPFTDNICSGAYLAYIQLISKFNKGFRFLLCFIDMYSKYTRVVPLKDKKRITISNALKKNSNKSKHKPNKIWVHKDNEFHNRNQ